MVADLFDIVDVRPLDPFFLHITFEDGLEGDIDIAQLVRFEGVFQPLSDEDFFAKVSVNSETGTIHWPNGADISPTTLRDKLVEQN